jgi:hypothetical protein
MSDADIAPRYLSESELDVLCSAYMMTRDRWLG